MERRNGQPMEPCVYHEELSQDIKSLKEDVTKIREWMVADELKQSFSEADITKVTEELNRLVCELKKTRQDFSKEIYELKLVLSKEYTGKEDLGSFATDIGNTLEKLNKKIDEGYAVLEKKIDVGDQKIKDDMKGTFRAIRTGGTIELSENTSSEIDFLNDRIKIFYCLWVDGEWVEWPLGEFLLASPTRKKSGVMKNRSIEVYDKILILQQDCRDDTFVVPAGTVVTTAVKDVIESTGEKSISMTDSTAETRHDWIWEPGTSALEIVNDLLSSINYFGVWVDGYGSFRVEPYVRLEQRTLVWTFFDDSESLYTPEISVDEDFFFIPNKVILVCSDPETEISASAVNVDPKSPFSYQNRGRWITDYREGEEASSAEVLEEKAKRILEQSMQVVEKVEIQHPWLPIEVNDAVMFRNSDLTLSSRYSVVEQKISLSATELVNTVLRRIVLYE